MKITGSMNYVKIDLVVLCQDLAQNKMRSSAS